MDKPQPIKFSLDLSRANYQIDALQNRLLEFYLRADRNFRRAFSINYTNDFITFIKDKVKLREPIHISTIGATRSGKSYTMITVCYLVMALYNKRFTMDYVCGNAYEFIEKLKVMPEEDLLNSIFLIDEEKMTVFGVGSIAKKMKIADVQNIIAINNISTIMLNPSSWANKEATYGLRTFGRCFKTKTVRMMLYNLSEKGKGGEMPMGMIYLPIFTEVLDKKYADELEKEYLEKKNAWVKQEMRGEGDVLAEIKKTSAKGFIKDPKFMDIKTKNLRTTYINQKMGSEWTKTEIEEIESITRLLREGSLD